MIISISLSQLSGTSSCELFLCGICDSLAIDPLCHDGGYNQNFCQRFYCRSCLPTRIGNPSFKRVNRQGRQETHCVHYPNCLVDFNHPYFRKPSGIERTKYYKIIIKCDFCFNHLTIPNYLTHIVNCTRAIFTNVPAGSLFHRNNNSILSNPLQPFLNLSMNFRRIQITSNNQLRSPTININNNISLLIRSSIGTFRETFSNNMTIDEVHQQIASRRNMDCNQIELVYFCHYSSRQFHQLNDFIQDFPLSGSVNLLERNANWSSIQHDARCCFIAFPPCPIITAPVDDANTEANNNNVVTLD